MKNETTCPMLVCNYGGSILKTLNLPNFQTHQLEINFPDVYVLRVGYTMALTFCEICELIYMS